MIHHPFGDNASYRVNPISRSEPPPEPNPMTSGASMLVQAQSVRHSNCDPPNRVRERTWWTTGVCRASPGNQPWDQLCGPDVPIIAIDLVFAFATAYHVPVTPVGQ
jgi:hypothetical protein